LRADGDGLSILVVPIPDRRGRVSEFGEIYWEAWIRVLRLREDVCWFTVLLEVTDPNAPEEPGGMSRPGMTFTLRADVDAQEARLVQGARLRVVFWDSWFGRTDIDGALSLLRTDLSRLILGATVWAVGYREGERPCAPSRFMIRPGQTSSSSSRR
jgi:hypothetical protein